MFHLWRLWLPGMIAAAGVVSLGWAVVNERRMQRHRQPGVSYAQVTWRRDGGWRRGELFTETGLAHQKRASRFGVFGAVLLVSALALLAALA
jgi:hypothetical protein